MSITKQKPRQSRKAVLHHKTKAFLSEKIFEYLKQFGATSAERYKGYQESGAPVGLHHNTLYKLAIGGDVQVKSLLMIFDFFKIEWVLVNGKYQHIENEK